MGSGWLSCVCSDARQGLYLELLSYASTNHIIVKLLQGKLKLTVTQRGNGAAGWCSAPSFCFPPPPKQVMLPASCCQASSTAQRSPLANCMQPTAEAKAESTAGSLPAAVKLSVVEITELSPSIVDSIDRDCTRPWSSYCSAQQCILSAFSIECKHEHVHG